MEHDDEPVPGLPGPLPAGEHILWQGKPDAKMFAQKALYGRWVAAYFVALIAYNAVQGSSFGVTASIVAGVVCLGMLWLFAWAVARTTIYTLTDRRIVLRTGVALTACINLPLKSMVAADLRPLGNGHADIALQLEGSRLGYAFLWPHARPWRVSKPQPMLRSVPDAERVATMLASARAALGRVTVGEIEADRAPAPAMEAMA